MFLKCLGSFSEIIPIYSLKTFCRYSQIHLDYNSRPYWNFFRTSEWLIREDLKLYEQHWLFAQIGLEVHPLMDSLPILGYNSFDVHRTNLTEVQHVLRGRDRLQVDICVLRSFILVRCISTTCIKTNQNQPCRSRRHNQCVLVFRDLRMMLMMNPLYIMQFEGRGVEFILQAFSHRMKLRPRPLNGAGPKIWQSICVLLPESWSPVQHGLRV